MNEQQQNLVDELFGRLSSVTHDINNPLSIISGNAQLITELAQAMDLGEDFLQPAQDIQDASQRIADSLDELDQIRKTITENQDGPLGEEA